MSTDHYSHSQCFLFILDEHIQKDAQQLRSSAIKRKRKKSEPQTMKVLALLPHAYVTSHAYTLSVVFKSNNIDIINEENESRLFHKSCQLKVIEILLNDDSRASIDPLCVRTEICDKYIRQLFPQTTILFDAWLHPKIRPVLDEFNLKLMERLLSKNVSIRYKYGFDSETSLLHLAAKRGQESFVELLLDHNADVDERDNEDCTPLHGAVSGGHPALVRLLINRGATVDARNKYGSTPLLKTSPDFLCTGKNIFRGVSSLKEIYSHIAEILLESGANVNARSNIQRTLIMNAARIGLLKHVCVLVKYGARVDILDEDGNSVLDHAAKHSWLLQYLLECCFLDLSLLDFNKVTGQSSVIDEHLIKVLALDLNPGLKGLIVFPPCSPTKSNNRDNYKHPCQAEIAKMKSEIPAGTSVSLYDVLLKTESQVAGLLRNDTVLKMADGVLLKGMFPIYGNILGYHFQKGLLRKSTLEEGIKIYSRLNHCFGKLPDEIKERIFGYLSNRDIFVLKGLARTVKTKGKT